MPPGRLRPRFTAAPEDPAKPWHKRGWVWLAASPLICCLLGGLLVGYVRLTIDSNPVYIGGLRRAEKNSQVRSKIGVPLVVTGVPSFQISPFGPNSITMKVKGPKGTGRLLVVARGEEPDSLEVFNMKLTVDASGEVIRISGSNSGD